MSPRCPLLRGATVCMVLRCWGYVIQSVLSPVQMLRAQDLDILAVQEVRFDSAHHTHNQVEELTRYLPGYQASCESPQHNLINLTMKYMISMI